MRIEIVLLLIAIVTFARAGEYPIITNNAIVDCESDSDLEKEELGRTEYLLFKNQLIDMRNIEFEIPNPKRAADADISLPVMSEYTENCHSPRNFLVGEYTSRPSKFVWQKSKFLNPRIKGLSAYIISDNDPDGPFDFDDPDNEDSVSRFLGLGNIRAVEVYPPQMNPKENMPFTVRREVWDGQKQYWYQLDPPLEIDYVQDAELPASQRDLKAENHAQNEMTVQGYYEIGGAIICGRKEDGVLTLYRLSCWQRTLNDPIQVFDQNEKLTWDNEASERSSLNALRNLRPDLLEHNTGLTENRLFIRMKNYKVKLDKPGATKALRDWYLLAPFYDPATKAYRETLDKTDFIANPNNGFDPNAADFNPQKFVKKMVPYTLPEGYWKSVQGP